MSFSPTNSSEEPAEKAAQWTGAFRMPASAEEAAARRAALRACEQLEERIAYLRAAAEKETQMPRLVELNLELKRAEAARAAALADL